MAALIALGRSARAAVAALVIVLAGGLTGCGVEYVFPSESNDQPLSLTVRNGEDWLSGAATSGPFAYVESGAPSSDRIASKSAGRCWGTALTVPKGPRAIASIWVCASSTAWNVSTIHS